MKKSIFLTSVLLIFIGLSVSANNYAAEYEFGSVLPSEQTAADAGIFGGGASQGNDMMYSSGPNRGWGDPGTDPGGGTGGKDPDDGHVDAPIGSGISILMLLTGVYGFFLTRRRKEQV